MLATPITQRSSRLFYISFPTPAPLRRLIKKNVHLCIIAYSLRQTHQGKDKDRKDAIKENIEMRIDQSHPPSKQPHPIEDKEIKKHSYLIPSNRIPSQHLPTPQYHGRFMPPLPVLPHLVVARPSRFFACQTCFTSSAPPLPYAGTCSACSASAYVCGDCSSTSGARRG